MLVVFNTAGGNMDLMRKWIVPLKLNNRSTVKFNNYGHSLHWNVIRSICWNQALPEIMMLLEPNNSSSFQQSYDPSTEDEYNCYTDPARSLLQIDGLRISRETNSKHDEVCLLQNSNAGHYVLVKTKILICL